MEQHEWHSNIIKVGERNNVYICCAGCATSVLVTSAGMGEMVMQVLVGSVSHIYIFIIIEKECPEVEKQEKNALSSPDYTD